MFYLEKNVSQFQLFRAVWIWYLIYIEFKNVNFKGMLIMLKLKDSVENQPALNLME